jgi:hypothetical protein
VEPGGSSREREAMSVGKEVGCSDLAAEEEVSKKKHERENEKTYLVGGERWAESRCRGDLAEKKLKLGTNKG